MLTPWPLSSPRPRTTLSGIPSSNEPMRYGEATSLARVSLLVAGTFAAMAALL